MNHLRVYILSHIPRTNEFANSGFDLHISFRPINARYLKVLVEHSGKYFLLTSAWKILFRDNSARSSRARRVFSFIRETNNLIDVFCPSSRAAFFIEVSTFEIRTSRRRSRNVVRITYVFKSLISSYFAPSPLYSMLQSLVSSLVKLYVFVCVDLSIHVQVPLHNLQMVNTCVNFWN